MAVNQWKTECTKNRKVKEVKVWRIRRYLLSVDARDQRVEWRKKFDSDCSRYINESNSNHNVHTFQLFICLYWCLFILHSLQTNRRCTSASVMHSDPQLKIRAQCLRKYLFCFFFSRNIFRVLVWTHDIMNAIDNGAVCASSNIRAHYTHTLSPVLAHAKREIKRNAK